MLAKAQPNISGFSTISIQHVVSPRLAIRSVLRYRRIRRRFSEVFFAVLGWLRRSPVTFFSHVLVLTLGFVLVVPAMGTRSAAAGFPVEVPSAGSHFVTLLNADNAMGFADPEKVLVRHLAAAIPTLAQLAVHVPRPGSAATLTAFTPPPGAGGDGLAAIYAVFNGSPGLTWALRVANCESHYNPLAVNRFSGASGLFQFMPSTWNAHFASWNIWDPYAQARAALAFYNNGATSAWTCK